MTDGSGQQSLLHGFAASSVAATAPRQAAAMPVAQVLIDSALPHLDRLFDYLVPDELDAAARPGSRVKVRFAGQELAGFLVSRSAVSTSGAKLSFLGKVVSFQPVLSPEIYELAAQVAARYVGTVSDVVRLAVPPRMARVEKEFDGAAPPVGAAAKTRDSSEPAPEEAVPPDAFAGYSHAGAYLDHLRTGGAPRAVLTSAHGYGPGGWPHQLAAVLSAVYSTGKGAIAVVPDQKDLERLEAALAAVIPSSSFVRLCAEDGPTPRYRNFLQVLHGQVKIVIGTRSAAYAPVQDLGLVMCWDDGDELHIEQRAPYQHVREVLLMRAEHSGAAVLIAGIARSTESQRLLETGWAQPIYPERTLLRRCTPRVINTADSFERERDPLAVKARLPQRAWLAAQEGLLRGPVLVQVARAGYAPSISCQRCREPARCVHCQGPLAQPAQHASLSCRWCARVAADWRCPHCQGTQLRISTVGINRTAEELGRAFPAVPVISSSGDSTHSVVADTPALVVATPGAEPVAAGGYTAALLLDGDSLLRRESLRAAEETLRRWFTAAALVRPAKDGGTVVITAEDQQVVGSLVRWDPAAAAERELAERRQLALPPSVRIAALTGEAAAIEQLLERAELPAEVRMVGPAPLPAGAGPAQGVGRSAEQAQPDQLRTLLFFSYGSAAEVTGRLRAARNAMSAKRLRGVNIRCDGVDLL